MDRRRVATPTLFRAAAALLLASSCAVAPFLPAAEAASQPIKQVTYCDGQGAAVRLGFDGYECPEHAIDPSFNSQSDPADSCEAIQVRGAAQARARGSLPSPTAHRPRPASRLLQIFLQKRDRRANLHPVFPPRVSQRLYPPAPDAPYWFYNTARKCLDDPWTRVEDATLIPHSSVPNPAGVRYQLSWGGGEYQYVDTDSGNMYKTPNATYESLTDGRGAWGDDEPVWRSGDTGDAAWLQADFGEIVTVNEIWVASGRDEVWGNCSDYSAIEYYVNASVDCTEGSFFEIGSLGKVSAPNHTVGAPPERRWPDGADEVTARCFRIYPAGDKSWGCLGEFRMEYRNPSPATCECESGACIWGEEATPRVEGGPVSRGPKGRYVRVVSPAATERFELHHNYACSGRNELGVHGDLSFADCAARCAEHSDCISFEVMTPSPSWTSTQTWDCLLSTSCTTDVMTYSGSYTLAIKIAEPYDIELDGHFIAWNAESLERFDESGMPEDLQLAVAATASSVTGVDPVNDPACYTYDWNGVDPAERHDACDVNVWNLNSLNDPYAATDKKETADGFLGEWIELDLGEDKVVDGVHIKFRDERTGISNPYFEILDANRDVVYNSSQRCEEKNCVLDLTNGPDAHPRDAGNDRLSDTSAAAAGSGRTQAFDWDLVVAHHSKWRNEIVIPPYYSVSLVATIGESLAAGNAVKSEEFPLGSTLASVNCSDEGFGIDRNNRTFAPDAKTKACWCRTRGLPVTKRWCDMKSDPAESNFDPPPPDLKDPSCVQPFHTVNGRVLV